MALFDKVFRALEKHMDKQEDIVTSTSPKVEQEIINEYEIVEKEILPEKMVCPDCGGITLAGLDFCDKCGGELANYDSY